MEAKFDFIPVSKPMGVYTHGGSLRTTIPAEVVKSLGLTSRSKVVFLKERKHRVALIVNAKDTELISPIGRHRIISFSVSRELAEKLSSRKE